MPSTPHAGRRTSHLFISYAQDDEPWAEWLAGRLKTFGHRVELPLWDWDVGADVVQKRADALARADHVVAVFSAAYFGGRETAVPDWSAVLAAGEEGRLLPVHVEHLEPRLVPASLRPLTPVRLAGLTEAEAVAALERSFGGASPARGPARFPGTSASSSTASGADLPRFPGAAPQLVDVPPRDKAFVDRPRCLGMLKATLVRTGAAALHGPAGMGKTALAVEYAHRHAAGYDTVYWTAAGKAAEPPRELTADGRWLVVVDGVDVETHVPRWARDRGHLIVTSRHGEWHKLATPVGVGRFERAESVELLSHRAPRVPRADAERVCERLADRPLLIEQAATVLNAMTVEGYLAALEKEPARMLDEPAEPGPTLTGLVRSDLEALTTEDEAAAQLLLICASLGLGPVPLKWFTDARAAPPEPLRTAMRHPVEVIRRLRRIRRLGLADVRPETLEPDPLVASIMRDLIAGGRGAELRGCAGRLLVAAAPGGPDDPRTWPRWQELASHVTALDPAEMTDSRLRALACQVCQFLQVAGHKDQAYDFAVRLHAAWERELGPDDEHVHNIAAKLAIALRTRGHASQAAELNRRSLDWAVRRWGADHAHTLAVANNLVLDLRQMDCLDEAGALAEDTFTRARRHLGEDHRQALQAADNLALILRLLGRPRGAYRLNEETLQRRRRIRGAEHPTTLITSANLAMDLTDLGEHERACVLMSETLDRMSRVMGPAHPQTLTVRYKLERLRDNRR